jgi:hypothetical protein
MRKKAEYPVLLRCVSYAMKEIATLQRSSRQFADSRMQAEYYILYHTL